MQKRNEPHNSYEICGAKTRSGTPCKRPSGWGTNHPGKGKCKLHGGSSTGPKDKSKLNKNINAKKHGLYAKYFPKDTLELFNVLENESPLEILWNNIKIQYSAIILAQKKMRTILEKNFTDKTLDEMILLNKSQTGLSKKSTIEDKTVREVIQDYESESLEYERYIEAQSRAMATLNNMIKNYNELCNSELATEEQKLRTEKLKVEIDKIKGINEEIEDLSDVIGDIYG